MTGGRDLYTVRVERDQAYVRPGSAELLFDMSAVRPASSFGIAPRGERFLLILDPEAEHEAISVLLNWGSRLESVGAER